MIYFRSELSESGDHNCATKWRVRTQRSGFNYHQCLWECFRSQPYTEWFKSTPTIYGCVHINLNFFSKFFIFATTTLYTRVKVTVQLNHALMLSRHWNKNCWYDNFQFDLTYWYYFREVLYTMFKGLFNPLFSGFGGFVIQR